MDCWSSCVNDLPQRHFSEEWPPYQNWPTPIYHTYPPYSWFWLNWMSSGPKCHFYSIVGDVCSVAGSLGTTRRPAADRVRCAPLCNRREKDDGGPRGQQVDRQVIDNAYFFSKKNNWAAKPPLPPGIQGFSNSLDLEGAPLSPSADGWRQCRAPSTQSWAGSTSTNNKLLLKKRREKAQPTKEDEKEEVKE